MVKPSLTFIAWDTETTGLDPLVNEIIQIGAVSEAGSFETLAQPRTTIVPQASSKVNGIYATDLETAPTFSEAIHAFSTFMNNQIQSSSSTHLVLLGHNSWTFDDPLLLASILGHSGMSGIHEFMQSVGKTILTADSQVAARKLISKLPASKRPKLRLPSLYNYFTGKVLVDAHTAKADAGAVFSLIPHLRAHFDYKDWYKTALDSLRRRHQNKLIKNPEFCNSISVHLYRYQSNFWQVAEKRQAEIQVELLQDGEAVNKTLGDSETAEAARVKPSSSNTAVVHSRIKTNQTCKSCGTRYSGFFEHTCLPSMSTSKANLDFVVFEYKN